LGEILALDNDALGDVVVDREPVRIGLLDKDNVDFLRAERVLPAELDIGDTRGIRQDVRDQVG
jgi:hypothetical protein